MIERFTTKKSERLDEQLDQRIADVMGHHKFHLVRPEKDPVPPGPIRYEGLTDLPGYKKKIDAAVATCRLLIESGVYIFDDFGVDHEARREAREALATEIEQQLGEAGVREYRKLRDYNLLRAGGIQQLMVGRVLDALGNGLIAIDTPEAAHIREIIARFPKIRDTSIPDPTSKLTYKGYQLSDEKFKWMADLMSEMKVEEGESVTESLAYRAMSDEQRMEIVGILESIAHDFLHFVIRENDAA